MALNDYLIYTKYKKKITSVVRMNEDSCPQMERHRKNHQRNQNVSNRFSKASVQDGPKDTQGQTLNLKEILLQ